MNCTKSFVYLLMLAAFSLVACSGVPQSGITPPPGTATLALTMSTKPLTPPPGTSILSFSVSITGIALNPASGTAVSFPLNTGAGTLTVDLTRLQSDSALLGVDTTVPEDSYSSITVSLSNPVFTYCTVNSGTPGCVPGSVTTILPSAATPPISTSLTLAANQQTGLALILDLNKAITLGAAQTVANIDLTATGVVTTVALPRTSSLATGQLDFIEDITGTVATLNGQVVTVQTATHGSFTATASASTVFSPNCVAADITCVQVGQVASLDTALNNDGTFKLLEYDPINASTTPHDWIEGVVTAAPTSTTQFDIVTNEKVLAAVGSLVGNNLALGAPVRVTLGAGAAFGVDVKGLLVPVQAGSFAAASDTSILLPGQTVAVRVTSFTIAGGATPAQATVDLVDLRFTRVAGTVSAVAPPNTFSMSNLPAFFGLTIVPTVQLSQGTPPNFAATNFDGVSSASTIAAGTGQTYSIRALYFGPGAATPFSAAKVRAN